MPKEIRRQGQLYIIALVTLFLMGVVTLSSRYWFGTGFPNLDHAKYRQPTEELFTSQYPSSPHLTEELKKLRLQRKLLPENEILIQRSLLTASRFLNIPPALFWCLLFQESRLNHLEGIEHQSGAKGLGQFSQHGFFEINNHLERFGNANFKLMHKMLGHDVRPIRSSNTDLEDPSSYFFIPTAVASSAAYLNNRYLHLSSILEKNKISYRSELLWLYATMAYNKGTRAVLSFWNHARQASGRGYVKRLVTRPETFSKAIKTGRTLRESLRSIWPDPTATTYAKELSIHLRVIEACALRLPAHKGD